MQPNLRITSIRLTTVLILVLLSPSPNALAEALKVKEPSTVVWAGFDQANGAYDFYSGFITALNGNGSTDGFLFRGDGVYVNVDESGQVWDGDVYIGYQRQFNNVEVAGFIGADFQRLPNSPGSKTQGYETGLKLAASVETDRHARLVGIWCGNYSTAFDTFWTKGRLGYNWKSVLIGPEAAILGNDSFRGERVSGFISIPVGAPFGRPLALDFVGGYQWVTSFETSADSTGAASGSTVGGSGVVISVGSSFQF